MYFVITLDIVVIEETGEVIITGDLEDRKIMRKTGTKRKAQVEVEECFGFEVFLIILD